MRSARIRLNCARGRAKAAIRHREATPCRPRHPGKTSTDEFAAGGGPVTSGGSAPGHISNPTQEIGMNKSQVKGRVEQVKGKIKKTTGAIVGSKKLEQRGRAEEIAGKIEANLGDLKDHLKKSI
jgi:uncharacterized protein YjbJ (UPF0337 family)